MEDELENSRQSLNGFAGFLAMFFSTIALLTVVTQLAAGPFAPQPTLEESVADLIIGVTDVLEKRSSGETAQALAHDAWDVDRILITLSISMAGIAMLFGMFALARNEPRLPALVGFGLGAGTLFVVWLQWLALIIVGALLLAAIVTALGGDFSL